ncbi:MAG: EamA family transporter [Pseudomonadota bacterium]
MSRTALGIVIMLVATSMVNVGAVLQKSVVDDLPPFEDVPLGQSLKALAGTPRWVIGWLAGIGGVALNMLALGLADIGLVQPLNGFGLAVLALFSWYYLGERLDLRAWFGMVLVIAGVVLVGALLPESQAFASSTELLACYLRPMSLAVLAALGAAAVLTWLASRALPWAAGILLALSAAACSVTGLTFSKGFTSILTMDGLGGLLTSAPALLLLVLLLGFASAALALQQLSLQKGRAVEVTPAFAAASVVLPLLPSWLVFREQLPALALLTPLLITAGVVLLGTRRAEAQA